MRNIYFIGKLYLLNNSVILICLINSRPKSHDIDIFNLYSSKLIV